jgi:hypothetical protein
VRQLLLKIFLFPFTVALIIIFLSGCEKRYDTVVDSVGIAPVLSDARFSLSVVNTDTINIGAERRPDDQLTIRGVASVRVVHFEDIKEIKTVRCSVIKALSSSSNGDGILHDDGVFPDQIANDSTYSGYVDFQILRVEVGEYCITFWSENRSGYIHSQDQHYQSDIALLPLTIVRLNHPPIISNLFAPITISLLNTTTFSISLKVLDPDGQQDIKSVLRFTPSGKILRIYAENDSIYSEIVTLNPPPSLGPYLFRFCAVDRSNDTSNILTKTIEIIE